MTKSLSPGSRSVGGEPSLGLGSSVRQGEFESRLEELFDVWSSDFVLLLNLGDSEDLD